MDEQRTRERKEVEKKGKERRSLSHSLERRKDKRPKKERKKRETERPISFSSPSKSVYYRTEFSQSQVENSFLLFGSCGFSSRLVIMGAVLHL